VAAQDDDEVDGVGRTLVIGDGRVHEGASDGGDSARELVRRTLRGPRAREADLLAAAERLGFRPDEADDR
jgi:hypothetical protein